MPIERITLPDAPPIPGLWFRPTRGQADAPAFHAIHAGRMDRDAVDPLSTLEGVPTEEEMRNVLANVLAEGRPDRYLVAQVMDVVIGYCRIRSWPETDGTWVYLHVGWVLPEWRGRGIGTAMLHWAEDRCRRLAAVSHPGEPFDLAGNASATEVEATALLLREGYHVGFTALEMGLDPAVTFRPHPLPAGFRLRSVLPADYPAIAASVDEAYRHEYPAGRYQDCFDPAGYVAEIGAPPHDPTLWRVAWDGDEVVGQVLAVIQRGRGEVFEVSVRPTWRRRGLARALLSDALCGLRDRGVDVIRLHTRADFPTRARDLYESLGFRVLKEFPRYRKRYVS